MDNPSVITTTRGDRPAPPPGSPAGRRTATNRAQATPTEDVGSGAANAEAAIAEAATIVLPRLRVADAARPASAPGRRARPAAHVPSRAVTTAATGARAGLAPPGDRVERLLRDRLGVTLRTPGRGGRLFLTMAGGAVILIALGAVVLGIGGGPAALRPLSETATPTPVAVGVPAAPRRPVTEVAGVPIAATRSYLLTSYAPGRGVRGRVETAPNELPVGRHYQHLPRRGDDHLLTAEIVFPLLPAPAACVSRVELRITLLRTDGAPSDEGPYPLAAYPSALTSLAAGRIPSTVPTLDLVANRPRGSLDWSRYGDTAPTDDATASGGTAAAGPASTGDATATSVLGATSAAGGTAEAGRATAAPPAAPREISADVTELYQGWVTGLPTAEGKPAVAPGTPLVLAVRPAMTNVLGDWQHTYAGPATRTPPRLVWTRRVHCD